jgi:hypothetical protein
MYSDLGSRHLQITGLGISLLQRVPLTCPF